MFQSVNLLTTTSESALNNDNNIAINKYNLKTIL